MYRHKRYLNKEAPIFHDSISPFWLNFKKDLKKKRKKCLNVLISEEQKKIVFRAHK